MGAGSVTLLSKNTVNAAKSTPPGVAAPTATRNYARNDDRYEIRERLKLALSQTVRRVPAKQLQQETGIPFRTIEGHRTGLVLCSFEDAVKYIRAMPSSPFTRDFLAMVSGEGEANAPENIDRLIRLLNTLRSK